MYPHWVKQPEAEVDWGDALMRLARYLRSPEGCPWDREQTYLTLRCYLLEECYEVVDALDRTDASALCEELGDLLKQRIHYKCIHNIPF